MQILFVMYLGNIYFVEFLVFNYCLFFTNYKREWTDIAGLTHQRFNSATYVRCLFGPCEVFVY